MFGQVEPCWWASRGLRRDLVGHLKQSEWVRPTAVATETSAWLKRGWPALEEPWRDNRRGSAAGWGRWTSTGLRNAPAGWRTASAWRHCAGGCPSDRRTCPSCGSAAAHEDRKHIRNAQIPEASPEELTFILSWTRLMSTGFIVLLPRCLHATKVIVSLSQSQQSWNT